MGNGDDGQPTESAPATADAGSNESASDSKPAESSDAPPALAETSKPESPKDVEMTDSKPAGESPQPSQDKDGEAESAKEPVAEAPTAPENPAPADVANEDVKEATTKPTSEVVQKSPEAPAQADQATADAPMPAVSTSEADLQPASLSQLAIETPATDTSPVLTSVEVSMTDAPGAKVAREREDDTAEEPASKRAKTEPREDEPSMNEPADSKASTDAPAPPASIEQSAAPSQEGGLSFDELPKFNDHEFNARVIQPFQKRDLRRSMARVKKTKNGGHFKDSVQRLWPALWDKYSESIAKPMDLGEIDRNLRDDKYKTFGEVKDDLALIAENSLAYNGPDHYMTMAAMAAIKSVWDDVMAIPEEEPVKHKPAPKQSRVAREPRTSNVKAEGAGAVDGARPHAGSPAAAPKAAPAADARRASTTADVDRPKRTVRAPKPKDIDYTTKPSRKKLKPELQFCDEVLSELMRDKYHHLNQWFNEPVDAVALKIPHYYSIVTEPMDLGKIQRMLYAGEIANFKEFDKYVRLVFSNCYKFNGPPQPGNVSFLAEQLEHIYNRQVKGKDAWLAKHAKANPPPASASTGSDDEEEDEDEDEGEDAGPDPTREVKDLEVRLREEMDKQANLFAAEQPNQSMIQIQQGIVNMVQQALLQAKQKLNEYKQKNGAAAAKTKKSKAKPKTGGSGGGGGRKSGGAAAQPKKATGGGGHKKKKNLTAADKDNIAGAINDLEYPHLDKASDIIKRDTGQMVSFFHFFFFLASFHRVIDTWLTPLVNRRVRTANWSWISTSLATRRSSSCGSSARRCSRVSAKTRPQRPTRHHQSLREPRHRSSPRQLPNQRRTNP